MRIPGAVAIITGAGGGIGAALAERFSAQGAEAVIVADRDQAAAQMIAGRIGGIPERLDVSDSAGVTSVVDRAIERFGRVDIYCANAGMTAEEGLDATDATWQRAFDVNVMAHVHAAQAVIPHMVKRGAGHFVVTASAAGLLTSPSDAPYSVTKHAAVGFAEWLAVSYGAHGIGISLVCPMGVATPMLMTPLAAGVASAKAVAASGDILSPEAVAATVADGIEAGTYLILPHPEVGTFWAKKAANPERWIAGMHRLVQQSATDAV